MRAIWNGCVLADSEGTVVVEGNHYFPRDAVEDALVRPSATTTVCSWKGTAHYFDVVANGKTNLDAAWHYPTPKPAARAVAGRLAFWRGVEVVD